MGSISGSALARCKECQCIFVWQINNMPFADTECIGTCGNCINKEEHNCVDETYDPPKILSRKTFDKR